ncbi:RNA 2',3'-cyclic phosphodiesterase [Roseospira visakhapatnamensis]|nr:RNA 2',3'-cyclic phosphodiesterase [Roseospira visakhapatnamensis]
MRLFVALAPPPELRATLAGMALGLPGARWVAADNLHLTLCFIGEVSPAEAEDLDGALSALRAPAVEVRLGGIGTFGQGRRVHALWVGAARTPALVHLQKAVERAVTRAGFTPERRKFTPHVTLARLRGADRGRLEGFIGGHNDRPFPAFTAEAVTLYRSHLTHDGAHYEPLADYPLEGGPLESGGVA